MSNREGPKNKTDMREIDSNPDDVYSKLSMEPIFLLLILILSIFIGETIIMLLLPRLIPPQVYYGSVIDALMLVVIIFPLLYIFSFKPLRSHIKELDRIKEELKRGEERYRSLVESTEDSIYLVDKECKYLFMNTKHQSRLGLSYGQCGGLSYAEFHSSEDTKEFEKMINNVFKTGRSIQHEHKSSRDEKYFLRTFSPIQDLSGTVEAVTVVSKDVTSLK